VKLKLELVTSHVETCEWASPRMVIQKICVHLKNKVCYYVKVDKHPFPRLNDVFDHYNIRQGIFINFN